MVWRMGHGGWIDKEVNGTTTMKCYFANSKGKQYKIVDLLLDLYIYTQWIKVLTLQLVKQEFDNEIKVRYTMSTD